MAGFTAVGYGLNRWMGPSVLWLLVMGPVIGIAVGFVGFFTTPTRLAFGARRMRPAGSRTVAPPASDTPVRAER